MRILYISHLGFDKATGLCWSVPSGISAQMEYDECFWINTRESCFDHWTAISAFHRLIDIGGKLTLTEINKVFPYPDFVVFEGFYHMEAIPFAAELYKSGIPYIIIPRGSLTRQAFHNHSFLNYLKKKLAVFLFFKRYTRRAISLQFLTESEYKESGDGWNSNHFILPNGISLPKKSRQSFRQRGLKIVYIGRPTIYHKGLDLLVKACKTVYSLLQRECVSVDCYVPEKNDYTVFLKMIQDNGLQNIVTVHPAVFGKEKEMVLLDSDVFIMTSRFEGHPMGLIEAMSYGLPVAVTTGTNMALEVEQNKAGWTSDCSVNGICTMIEAIIKEKDLLPLKGSNARDLAAQYEWRKLAAAFHETLTLLTQV